MPARGTREEVWVGDADRTSGGLTRADLVMNKRGRIVSRAMSARAVAGYPALKAKLCGPRELDAASLADLYEAIAARDAGLAIPRARDVSAMSSADLYEELASREPALGLPAEALPRATPRKTRGSTTLARIARDAKKAATTALFRARN